MKFTMKDQSTEPYGWMIKGVDIASVAKMGAKKYVKAMAEQAIDGMDADTTVNEWMDDSFEFEEAVAYIQSEIDAAS